MNILFYGIIRNERFIASGVHVLEVLNNLSKLGHSIVSADGQKYSRVEQLNTKIDLEQDKSLWERINQLVLASTWRGEAIIFWSFLVEVKLFLSGFITILCHKPEVIYNRRRVFFNSGYFLAKLFKVPLVKEVNGIIADEKRMTNEGDRVSLWIFDRIERFNMPKADKIIVVTTKLKEVLQEDYGVPGDKIVVIPNGANIDLFRPMDTSQARKELDLNQDAYYICYAGSLQRWQGVEGIIKSLPLIIDHCPNTQLLIVGDGPMRPELMELAKQVGVSNNVIFTGMVPYHKVPLYINASDICVIVATGNWRNEKLGASPLKLYVYMACGKAVIASRLTGLDVLQQQSAGTLVDPENAPELATAVIKLLKNKELRRELGENGRKYVVENQSWESVAKRVADVCQSLVEGRTLKAER